jgi:hypothetical protein
MVKKYIEFIKESGVEAPTRHNTQSPYDSIFDEIQNFMKKILVERGNTPEQAELLITNDSSKTEEDNVCDPSEPDGLIIQFSKDIQKEVPILQAENKSAKDIAKIFLDKYLNKTVFNNQGEEPEPNALIGDRPTNNLDS